MNNPRNQSFKTTCSYCGVGCGIVVKKDSLGSLSVEGDEEHPVNRGMLCSKGRTIHHAVADTSDRLKFPQMRWGRNHPLERVSWDTAIERAASVFKAIIEKHGPDSVGFYVSGQCLTEEYYLVNKLVKGYIGTNNIDTNSRLCMSSAVVGYKMALGEDSVPGAYADIELADTFFIAGANPAWCHPILFRRIEQHKEANPNVKLIVVDPRKTDTCMQADLHLQLKPGTDVSLYLAIGRVLIESGKIDTAFIDSNTEGYESYKENAFEYTVAEAAEKCGLTVDEIELAAKYIGDAKGFISMWAMGLNQSVVGVNKNLALLNISLITGHIGKPGSGPFSLTGQPNAMGGREVGGLSNMLPAHRDLANPDHRQEVADFWGVTAVPSKPGLSATEMFEALDSGKMKAVWVICTNPIVSLPDARKVEAAMKKAKFVVVQDISNRSNTVDFADLVLPAAGYMEKEGTMTNSERRVSYLPKIIDAPGEALSDSEILIRFAKKMGYSEGFNYQTVEDVYREHGQLTKNTNLDVSGIDYSLLKFRGSVQWPYTSDARKSTERLFEDHKFFTNTKKAKLFSVAVENQSEATTEDFPFILTTGRIRDQWHTMTRTGKVKKLNQHIDKAFAEIHPEDAEKLGVVEGDVVRVFNGRGETQVPAKITDAIRKGVVFMPMHFGKQGGKDLSRVNNLTNNLVDPKSKEPDFKFAAVNVVKYAKPRQKICIVGAGAAAFKFVEAYRSRNERDEIKVFSNEPVAFYNRVMLPDYISGEKGWDNLLKQLPEKIEPACDIFDNNGIVKIDRQAKTILDAKGQNHSYDILIMATGSRAFRPPGLPDDPGIHTLRQRKDADNIKKLGIESGHVVIVGGGLLGIELADSLVKIGVEVTVIQRSNRLMERQLDEIASEFLDLELKELGINILYNDEVRDYDIEGSLKSIRLRSGRVLECSQLVFAIGTKPNVEIAKEAGLRVGRGVVVNDFLQTSDSSVYALGEIAEHKQNLYGITAAAEEQASLLADYLLGDNSVKYQGSLLMNILKVDGVQCCSIGTITVPDGDDSYEEIMFLDKRRRYYKKCVVHHGRMIGCILMGDKSEFLEYRDLIKNKIELDDKRKQILLSSGPANEVVGNLVCSCNSVGDGNIKQAIKDGCTDLGQLCQSTGAGTGCGSCKPEVLRILEASFEEVELAKK